ncbi:hypothetical protein BU17DRAFT_68491 [Hysterangium stoloniferum]|nr:hypothetical protein BU17DRAFT_68491 [Hysterangium stoloniferum]
MGGARARSREGPTTQRAPVFKAEPPEGGETQTAPDFEYHRRNPRGTGDRESDNAPTGHGGLGEWQRIWHMMRIGPGKKRGRKRFPPSYTHYATPKNSDGEFDAIYVLPRTHTSLRDFVKHRVSMHHEPLLAAPKGFSGCIVPRAMRVTTQAQLPHPDPKVAPPPEQLHAVPSHPPRVWFSFVMGGVWLASIDRCPCPIAGTQGSSPAAAGQGTLPASGVSCHRGPAPREADDRRSVAGSEDAVWAKPATRTRPILIVYHGRRSWRFRRIVSESATVSPQEGRTCRVPQSADAILELDKSIIRSGQLIS